MLNPGRAQVAKDLGHMFVRQCLGRFQLDDQTIVNAPTFFAPFALFRGRIPSVPFAGTGLLYAGGRFNASLSRQKSKKV
jgi:hypothetical protein